MQSEAQVDEKDSVHSRQEQQQEPQTKEQARALIGRRVSKVFPTEREAPFEGVVSALTRRKRPFWWRVDYEDGDREELSWDGEGQLGAILQPGFAPIPQQPMVKTEPQPAAGAAAPGVQQARKKAKAQPEADENHPPAPTNVRDGAGLHTDANEEPVQDVQPTKRRRTQAAMQQPASHADNVLRPRQTNARNAQAAPVASSQPSMAQAMDVVDANGRRMSGLAGHLQKIRLENFMCHELFEMEFGPEVTLISGTNGSGKSAIMQGLQACLGVSARSTGRATSLAQFIRTGCDYAHVQVTLYNTGLDAFEPEKFGNRIIIERRFTRSSGGGYWRSCNSSGKEVKEHKPKEVLKHLGVNAANPLTIITQDMARAFLSGSSDDKKRKYMMFMEGTLLSEIRGELADASTHVANSLGRLRDLKADLKEKEERVKVMKERVEKLQEVQRQIEVRDAMDHAREWVLVWEETKVAESLRDKVQNRGPQRRTELKKAVEEAVAALQGVQGEEDALNAAIAESQQAARNAAADLQRLKEEHTAHVRNIRKLRQKREAAEQQKKDLEAQKQECEKVLNEDMGEKAQQRRVAMEKLEQDLGARRDALHKAEENLTANRLSCSALQAQMDEVRKIQGRTKGEIDSHARQIDKLQSDMQQLGGGGGGNDNVVKFGGNRVIKLLQLIQSNGRRFSRLPVGPVGAHLGLRDSKWAKAVQMAIGASLETFLVNNMQDSNALRDLAKTAGFDLQQFNVAKINFDIPQHNLPKPNASPGVTPLISALTVSDPAYQAVVMNWLVDTQGVEKAMLFDNEALAEARVWQGDVQRGYIPDGTVYQRQGRSKVARPYNNRTPLLGLDHSEMLQQMREGVESSKAAIREAEGRLREAEAKMGQLNSEYRELQRQQTELGKAKKAAKQALDALQRDLAAQQQAAAAEQRQGDEMDELATQVQSFQAELLQTQVQLDDIDTKLREATEAEQAARQLFEQRKEMSAQQPDLLADHGRRLEEVLSRKAYHEERRNKAQAKLADVDNQLNKLQADLQKREGDIEQMKRMAEQVVSEEDGRKAVEAVEKWHAERTRAKILDRRQRKLPDVVDMTDEEIEAMVAEVVAKRMTSEAIHADRQKLDGAITAGQRDAGDDKEQLERELERLQKVVIKAKVQYNTVREVMKLMHQSLESRQDKYKELRDNITETASNTFQRLMVRRQHIGRLEVNDEAEELTLWVRVKGAVEKNAEAITDLKQMSGGERSYTTVAYLLALGQHTESPFRCMDEFDVFMDAINRRVATETLLEAAYHDSNHQYIFLTPQDIQAVDDAKRNIESKVGHSIGDTFLKTVLMRPARP